MSTPKNKDISRILEWKAKNPDRVRANNKVHVRKYADKRRGAAADLRAALLAKQNGRCAICGTTEVEYGKALSMDHCHTAGAVRGLLCNPCNMGLGCFRDDPERLVAAARYLRRFMRGR